MNESTTTWNEPFIANNKISNPNVTENFQVENMKYKIKKIKNKKRRIENYKKIPLFETLSNDTSHIMADSNITDPIIADSIIAGPNITGPITASIEPTQLHKLYNYVSSIFTKEVIEPMGAKSPDDYDCGDNVANCDKNKGGSGLDDIIERIYQYIIALNKWLAKLVLMTTSSEYANKDIDIVAHYIALLEGVTFSSIVVYNWFFLIYYMETKNITPIAFSREQIKKYAEDTSAGSTFETLFKGSIWIFLFIFEYAIFFPEMLDNFLLKILPKYTKKVFNGTFCFILLFFAILYASIFFTYAIKNVAIDIIQGAKSTFTHLMFGVVIILFIIDVSNYQKLQIKKANDSFASGGGIGAFFTLMNASAFNTVGLFLYYLIRFIIIVIVSVPVGTMFCGLYFLFYSLFGISMYQNVDFVIIQEINRYVIATSNFSSVEKPTCQPVGWFRDFINKCMAILNVIMDIFYLKLFAISYIITLLFAAFNFNKSISIVKSFINIPFSSTNIALPKLLALMAICGAISLAMLNITGDWTNLSKIIASKLAMFKTNTVYDNSGHKYKNDELYDEYLVEKIKNEIQTNSMSNVDVTGGLPVELKLPE